MPRLSKEELGRLLPHGGSMRLLDAVDAWDEKTIRCTAVTHRDRANPLRHHDILHAIAGLEYAAQAMGAHVALINPDRPDGQLGYLGGIRDLVLDVERLDDITPPLTVDATRMLDGKNSYMYHFVLTVEGRSIMAGRASIFVKSIVA
jgi:predicted hotdog family 3-hydroxylacyl-ACP dehydratase